MTLTSLPRVTLRWSIAIVSVWIAPVGAFELGDPYFETVGDAESIPEGVVTALAQDAAGYIWIGTPNGLIRFDGYRFRRSARESGDWTAPGGDYIMALLPARDA